MTFKPMLAATASIADVRFPVAASPKVDGMRCIIIDDMPRTRSMKPIRNRHVQKLFQLISSTVDINGLDGELVVGEPNAPRVLHTTTSALNSIDGEPLPTFYVFDYIYDGGKMVALPYITRYNKLVARSNEWVKQVPWFKLLEINICNNVEELEVYEEHCLNQGYEGVILRSLDGGYKQNRSTLKEGGMLKLKRFADNEAIIIGFEEEMHNNNQATVNELGYMERSSHKENKIPTNTLGRLLVRGVNGIFKDVEFKIGSGLDDQQSKHIWDNRDKYLGALIKYKHFPVGVKDLPRHPVWLGFRDRDDMSDD